MSNLSDWQCCATCYCTHIPLAVLLCLEHSAACFLQTLDLVKRGKGMGCGGHNCNYWAPKDNPGPEYADAETVNEAIYNIVLTEEK